MTLRDWVVGVAEGEVVACGALFGYGTGLAEVRTTVVRDDGRRHVTFTYRDNGRGPDIEEDIALLVDGTFRSYRQQGRTTFGAKLDERFEIAGDKASWRSPAESGQKSLPGPAVYLPVYGSPICSSAPCIVPSSPKRPCSAMKARFLYSAGNIVPV